MKKSFENEKAEILTFLKGNASFNSFLIGDIENFSFDESFIDVWCDYKESRIISVLLRYYSFYLFETKDLNYCKSAADIIKSNKSGITISCEEKIFDKLNEFIGFSSVKKMYLAELDNESFISNSIDYSPQQATINDIEELYQFKKNVEEFDSSDDNREAFGKEIVSNTGKIFYIKESNKIVSSATITAENSVNGMIINVATDKDYRNKGYALSCVSELCRSMIMDNKKVILFYNNPKAGALYKKIGFKDIGRWAMGKTINRESDI